MAKIDDLTRQVSAPRLRRELEAAVAELKRRTRFGLVYESHLPEMAALPGLPVTEGALVVRREKLSARHTFRVPALAGGTATLEPVGGGPAQCAPVSEPIALQRFGKPICPGLERANRLAYQCVLTPPVAPAHSPAALPRCRRRFERCRKLSRC